MGNYAKTYQHIADILSFETSNNTLESTLKNPTFNWDNIVIEGSKYLVLPAIYSRLKSRELLHTLPEELNNYLEEIASVNRNRNKSILKQVHSISKILNENNINHVFLKGTALLASGKYNDIAERMVGDIDILVEKSQIHEAFNILKSNGYNKTFGFAYETKDFRHLDRLISESELAAIEIHSDLLIKKHRSLIDISSVLKSKIVINDITIPNSYYLSLHQIWSWQLNDRGHYYNFPSLKVLYDTIVVKSYTDDNLISSLLILKYGKSFLELAKHYFQEFSFIDSTLYMKYIKYSHKITMSNKLARVTSNIIKVTYFNISKRLHLIFTNRSYLRHILNILFSRK
ncbi:nucleotidyltransferase family protein [uncultured Winogradskyella sp.]|uniref:nucleotidyltransferase family protein n=1 Tax=uncultured Winogradskyella sp. TaxID=395353 RepID=UPI0026250EDD|nr:nucleotidyltransferase family protein [uncultured Winogradskyella sp.]|tara:strand:+ start:1671 stop:2702 length:1032 start_codon:yes stop_codon:yes gene_type:complete